MNYIKSPTPKESTTVSVIKSLCPECKGEREAQYETCIEDRGRETTTFYTKPCKLCDAQGIVKLTTTTHIKYEAA